MKLLLLLIVTFPVCLIAQIESGGKFIYTGLNYSPITLNKISPVIGFYLVDDKNNINDFQMNYLNFSKNESYTGFGIRGSYHKIIGLNKKSDSKFYLGLGVGASLYYIYSAYKSQMPYSYNSGNAQIGTLISVKPVVNYAFSKRLYLGLSSNVGVLNQSITFSRYENPAIPINQQRNTVFNMEIGGLSNLSFDLTLGFKIN